MRFGLSVSNFGDFGSPQRLVQNALTAEKAGCDGVFIWDHIEVGHRAGPVVDP